jgi:hypothetical protein
MSLGSHITDIGRELVACSHNCEGIILDPVNGILPRFLVLEAKNRRASRGSVIVGINPGRARTREREFYVTQGPTYENTVEYWEKAICRRKYYRWLRKLVGELGFSGPILWTELAKCESAPETSGLLPLQTFRTCVGMFLQQEIEYIPHTWPLIAVGKEAYKAMAYLFPKRAVLGVPHPTGSYGYFPRMFDGSERLLPTVRMQAIDLWTEKAGKSIWLTAATDP